MTSRMLTAIRMHVIGADALKLLKRDFRGHAASADHAGRKVVYDVTLMMKRAKKGKKR